MKYLLLVLGVFTSALLHAQFAFYAEGGGNYSDLRITRNPGGTIEGKGGIGWQAGAGVEYHTQFGFFYTLRQVFQNKILKKILLLTEILKVLNHTTLINRSF